MDTISSPLLKDKGSSSLSSFTPPQAKVLDAELDHSLRYFLIFIGLGGGTAVWLSWLLYQLQQTATAGSLLNIGLVSTLLLLVMIFQSVLIQSTQFNATLVAIEAAALLSFFYVDFSPWFIAAAVLVVVAWLAGFNRARVLLSNVMKINFWHYSLIMAGAGITGLAFFLSFIYLGFYQRAGGITFNSYKFVVSGALPSLQYAVPNFSPDTQVDSFFEDVTRNYLEGQSGFETLPAGVQQEAVQETSTGLLKKLTELTNLNVKPGETVLSYTFRWVNDLLTALERRGFGALVVIGIFFIIFLSIKGVMFFVKWPLVGITFMIFMLLEAVGVISIGAEMRQKEVILVK